MSFFVHESYLFMIHEIHEALTLLRGYEVQDNLVLHGEKRPTFFIERGMRHLQIANEE